MRRALTALLLAACPALLTACGGPAYVRGSDHPDLDKAVMSTGLDKIDLAKLFAENEKSLFSSGLMRDLKRGADDGGRKRLAIFRLKNDTSEHIDDQLDTLLSKFETKLVNQRIVQVISHERQAALLAEIKLQQSAAFDPNKSAQLGRQLGAQYFLTGKIKAADEKSAEERRVQYFLFMQIIDVETGAVEWQNEAELTKGLIN